MEEGYSRQDGRVTDHDAPRAISRQQGIQLIFAGRLNLGWRRRHERLAVAGRQRLRQPPVPERSLVVIDDRCRIGVSRRQRGCGADIDLRHAQTGISRTDAAMHEQRAVQQDDNRIFHDPSTDLAVVAPGDLVLDAP